MGFPVLNDAEQCHTFMTIHNYDKCYISVDGKQQSINKHVYRKYCYSGKTLGIVNNADNGSFCQ